jgi:hypothetical protein
MGCLSLSITGTVSSPGGLAFGARLALLRVCSGAIKVAFREDGMVSVPATYGSQIWH